MYQITLLKSGFGFRSTVPDQHSGSEAAVCTDGGAGGEVRLLLSDLFLCFSSGGHRERRHERSPLIVPPTAGSLPAGRIRREVFHLLRCVSRMVFTADLCAWIPGRKIGGDSPKPHLCCMEKIIVRIELGRILLAFLIGKFAFAHVIIALFIAHFAPRIKLKTFARIVLELLA